MHIMEMNDVNSFFIKAAYLRLGILVSKEVTSTYIQGSNLIRNKSYKVYYFFLP